MSTLALVLLLLSTALGAAAITKLAARKAEPKVVYRRPGPITLTVTTYWNVLHDAGLVVWDYQSGHSVPADCINRVVSMLANNGYCPAWTYVWWDKNREQQGLLYTAAMDLELEEVAAICEAIVANADNEVEDEWKVRIDELSA